MKTHLFLLLSILVLFACNRSVEDLKQDAYFLHFSLKDSTGIHEMEIPVEDPISISGNGVRNFDSVWVGFGIQPEFQHPAIDNITHAFIFYLSVAVPESEFVLDSGRYFFIQPSHLIDYLPTGSIIENETIGMTSYFYGNFPSYCSASLATDINNHFYLDQIAYFLDDNQQDAMNVEGRFELRYNPFHSSCDIGPIELLNGSFRIKVLIDDIP